MNVENALSLWAAACDPTGIPWYLYRETLLCVVGYGHFPDSLTHPQVAVFAKDLSFLVNNVFPQLPGEWELDVSNFGRKKYKLLFLRENTPVLELCVLYGMDETSQIRPFKHRINRTVRRINRTETLHKLGSLIPLYRKNLGKLVQRGILRLQERTFRKLLALADTTSPDGAFYWEKLTNKFPVSLANTLFEQTLTLTCNEVSYPVFSGYQEYLSLFFGDYETGLTDEIGIGLTADEKEALKAHQARCFEALTFLQEISQEYGLRYYLLAGSVLGCVRHGGFIPWDDDIDVGIRIEELERFEQIVKEQLPLRLPEGFALMQPGANNPYPRMFSKICYEGRCCIDLWPLVPTYTDGFRADFLWYFGKLITKVHYAKIGHKVTRFRKPVKLLQHFLTDSMVMALARHNERKYAGKNAPAYINLYSIYRRPKETILREWLDTPATATFEGLEVPVVGCTDAYLTHLYGNYMAFPAPWSRVSRHVERFYPAGYTTENEIPCLE